MHGEQWANPHGVLRLRLHSALCGPVVWFKAFGALAIAPGVAPAALVFLRPLKGVISDLRGA